MTEVYIKRKSRRFRFGDNLKSIQSIQSLSENLMPFVYNILDVIRVKRKMFQGRIKM